jgi:hypothetical protein
MDVAGNALELDKISLVECTADAERPDGTGCAAAETGTK